MESQTNTSAGAMRFSGLETNAVHIASEGETNCSRKDHLRKITSDQQEIRRWAAQRNAHPIERAPFAPDGEPAQLGFVFGETPGVEDHLQPIDWSRFFAIFQLMGLMLAYEGGTRYELIKLKDEGKNTDEFEGKPMQA